MPFISTLSRAWRTLPCKVYLHSEGFSTVFNSDSRIAFRYFIKEIYPQLQGSYFHNCRPFTPEHAIAVIWGDNVNSRPATDVFFYAPANSPNKHSKLCPRYFRGREPTPEQYTFGDVIILNAAEEKLRRATPELTTFIQTLPDLGSLWQPYSTNISGTSKHSQPSV